MAEEVGYTGNKRIPELDELLRNMNGDDQLVVYDPITNKTYRIPGRRIVTAELLTGDMYLVFHYPEEGVDLANPYWVTDPYVMVYRQGALYRLAYPSRPYGSTDFDLELADGHWELVSGTGLLEEADPVFVASPAYGITAELITQWNQAYAWGNHADAGYLKINATNLAVGQVPKWNGTEWVNATDDNDGSGSGGITQELDPVFAASPAYGIAAGDITNWNTAYGWGNHAGLYALVGHTHALNDLSDVGLGARAENQVLSYVGGQWTNRTLPAYLTAETDPVFSASPAKSITNQQLTQWNNAYGWGNHALAGYLKTESDPVFNASPAKGITSGNITQWNQAYNWGNHALAGYLTSYTETDPIFNASAAKGITAALIANWNAAYSWGNHASAGYLTALPAHGLNQHSDVMLATPTAGQALIYNGTNWVNGQAATPFTSIAENEFEAHPAFASQHAFNTWVLTNWMTFGSDTGEPGGGGGEPGGGTGGDYLPLHVTFSTTVLTDEAAGLKFRTAGTDAYGVTWELETRMLDDTVVSDVGAYQTIISRAGEHALNTVGWSIPASGDVNSPDAGPFASLQSVVDGNNTRATVAAMTNTDGVAMVMLQAFNAANFALTYVEITPDGMDITGTLRVNGVEVNGGDGGGSTAETDPVFTASAASSITTTQVTNWNTAHGWGNHALAGYLTALPAHGHDVFTRVSHGFVPAPGGTGATRFMREDGTWVVPTNTTYTEISDANLQSATGSTAGLISGRRINAWANARLLTTANIANWNTAYGWGNHALAGYLTDTALNGYVPLYSALGTELTWGPKDTFNNASGYWNFLDGKTEIFTSDGAGDRRWKNANLVLDAVTTATDWAGNPLFTDVSQAMLRASGGAGTVEFEALSGAEGLLGRISMGPVNTRTFFDFHLDGKIRVNGTEYGGGAAGPGMAHTLLTDAATVSLDLGAAYNFLLPKEGFTTQLSLANATDGANFSVEVTGCDGSQILFPTGYTHYLAGYTAGGGGGGGGGAADPDLRAWYRFEENGGTQFLDSAAGAHHATIAGTGTPSWQSPIGDGDYAAFLDSDVYGTVADHADLRFNGSAFTVGLRFAADAASIGDVMRLISKATTALPAWYLVLDGGGLLSFRINSAKAEWATAITYGQSYEVVASWDGTVMRLFVDGALAAEHTPTAGYTWDDTGTPLTLGSRDDGGVRFWGKLDDVRLYARAVTTAQEAADLMAVADPTGATGGSSPTVAGITLPATGAATLHGKVVGADGMRWALTEY